jgi:tetratricopeptide (TPR) repeat protein
VIKMTRRCAALMSALLTTLLVAGCATPQPTSEASVEPRPQTASPPPARPRDEPPLRSGGEAQIRPGAVLALVERAQRAQGLGALDEAAEAIERALRLTPRDAGLWLDLAALRLDQGAPEQAEASARKGIGLSDEPGMLQRGWLLVAEALERQGESRAADEARARARAAAATDTL